jgi:hypothetical protein
MRPVFLVSTLGALLLALIYQSEWLSTFLIIGGILAVTLGLAVLIAAHVSLVVRSNFPAVYTKPVPERKTIRRYLTVSTHFFFSLLPVFYKKRSKLMRSPCVVMVRGVHLNGVCTCILPDVFILPTLLTLMFHFICSLFNVICPSLVPILNEVNAVSTLLSVSTLVISRQQFSKHIPRPLLGSGFVNVSRSLLGSGLVNTFPQQ